MFTKICIHLMYGLVNILNILLSFTFDHDPYSGVSNGIREGVVKNDDSFIFTLII